MLLYVYIYIRIICLLRAIVGTILGEQTLTSTMCCVLSEKKRSTVLEL